MKKLHIRKVEELSTTASPNAIWMIHAAALSTTLTGRDWGALVSATAKSSPAAIAIHKGVGPQ
jgi:hypothetical protein